MTDCNSSIITTWVPWYKRGAKIDRMMQGSGEAVHLLLDTGHATWGGDDPVRPARTYRSRNSHVRCKDVRLDVKARSAAGDGKVD